MGADRALRASRRARGVEDRRVVVGVDLDLGCGGVASHVAAQLVEEPHLCGRLDEEVAELVVAEVEAALVTGDDLEVRGSSVLVDDHDEPGRVLPAQVRRKPRQPLEVAEHDPRPGVRDAVGELVAGPPGVEGDRDAARGDRGPERDHPLGKVAHRDRHAVAALEARLDEAAPRRRRRTSSAPRSSAARPRRPRSPCRRGRGRARGRCASVGGACFQTRSSSPRITAVPISKI